MEQTQNTRQRLSAAERLVQYCAAADPYLFRVGETTVRTEFSAEGDAFKACLERAILAAQADISA